MAAGFLVLTGLIGASAVATVWLRRAVHSMLTLMACLVAVAGLYLFLGAAFVGLMQIVVYIGAVAILIVFAMMMTQSAANKEEDRGRRLGLAGWIVGGVGCGLLGWAIYRGVDAIKIGGRPEVPVREIGIGLMHEFMLPMELLGLLLMVALFGAGVIALEERGQR